MSSGCKSAVGCVDARVPMRATYVNLYKWPESDAEFVRGLSEKSHTDHTAARGLTNNAHVRRNSPATRFGPSPAVVDSYSCRQIFLKSYTFTKKETVSEKTVRCFGKVKERAACGCPRSDSGEFTDGGTFIGRATNDQNQKNKKKTSTNAKRKNNKKSKGCVKRLKEASYSALSKIFHGLLSCGVGVDVEDQRFEGS